MDVRCRVVRATRHLLVRYHWIAEVSSHALYAHELIFNTTAYPAIDELAETGEFTEMDIDTDEDEHSIEMHLPYIRKVFEGSVISASIYVH
jgi:hypothetical protein